VNVTWNTDDDRRRRRPGRVFLCYSHLDLHWAQRVMTMLRPLVHSGELSVWFDADEVRTGDRWRSAALDAARRSDVGLLLVSPDFLDSDGIRDLELPTLTHGGARLAPVLLRDCLWTLVRPEWEDLQWLDRHPQEGSLSTVADNEGEVCRRITEMCHRLVDLARSAAADLPCDDASADPGPTASMRDLRPLCEARRHIEPAAAELAAQHADHSQRTNLEQAFAVMTRSRGDSEAYRAADTHFHMTLVQASRNPHFACFDEAVAHILDCRTKRGLMPAKPVTEDAHANVLRAVLRGDERGARRATQAITDEALTATFERRRSLSPWPLLPWARRDRRPRREDPRHPFA
jgi:hypothetical protein